MYQALGKFIMRLTARQWVGLTLGIVFLELMLIPIIAILAR